MKKGKIAALAVAGTLTATALLAGTYAWTSISQKAMNEVEGSVNPGGRLHDDFNGENKDIYVENFTSGEDGANIYARIKLAEYLEIGGAAVENNDGNNKVTPTYNQEDTWITFKLHEEDNNIYRNYFEWTWGKDETKTYLPTFNKNKDSLDADINGTMGGIDADKKTDTAYEDYIEYATDGSAYEGVKQSITVGTTTAVTDDIVPAGIKVSSRYGLEIYDIDDDENKSNDARDEAKGWSVEIIKALHNGTGGIAEHFYNDSTNYPDAIAVGENVDLIKADGTVATAKVIAAQDEDSNNAFEYVDLDLDDDDEEDVRVKPLEIDATTNQAKPHEVKQTQVTTDVITMAEWNALPDAQKQGNYWVYDTDGWAYWANVIEPGEATGTLLTAIERKGSIVDKYYYAINVTAEFATAGDWGKDEDTVTGTDATGFYINDITPEGLQLLNTIAGEEKDIMISADSSEVKPGNSLQLTSTVKLGAQTLTDDVAWTLDDSETANMNAAISSSGTKIDPMTGVLEIGADEEATALYVTAYLTRNPNVKAHKMITITEKLNVTVTTDNAENLVIPENIETLALKATVTNQWNENRDANVTWSLDENTITDKPPVAATIDEGGTIDTDYTQINPTTGVLKVGTEETSNEIVVRATSNVDGDAVAEFKVNLKTQLQYLDDLSKVEANWGLVDNYIKIDGINWYILRRVDADGDNAEEVLLWASQGVKGWGGSGKTYDWSYWSEDFEYNTGTADTDGSDRTAIEAQANWWRYSNARAWLNSKDADEKDVTENRWNWTSTDGWIDLGPTTTSGNIGFLADKEILSNHAATVEIKTKHEFNDSNTIETNYEKTQDQIFLLTQADIFGHTSNLGNNSDTAVSEYDYTVPGMELGTSLLQDIDANGDGTEENSILMRKSRNLDNDTAVSEWSWLRSPRANANYVAFINYDGTVYYNYYRYSNVRLRPALWMNLSSSSQGE